MQRWSGVVWRFRCTHRVETRDIHLLFGDIVTCDHFRVIKVWGRVGTKRDFIFLSSRLKAMRGSIVY